MAETVNQHQQTTFTAPINGTTADASEVLNNDNTLRGKHNEHDSDAGIHVQSSTAAARPAAGVAGRKWFTTDTKRFYYDNGTSWVELDYAAEADTNVFTDVQTFTRTNGTDIAVQTRRAADASHRLKIDADGKLEWNDGAGGDAITLENLAAGGDSLQLAGASLLIPNGSIAAGESGGGGNSGAAVTLDLRNGNTFIYTLTANTAFTFSNDAYGHVFYLILIGDGSVRTPTWPAGVRWAGAAAPTFTSTANRADVVMFVRATAPGPQIRYYAARIMQNCG